MSLSSAMPSANEPPVGRRPRILFYALYDPSGLDSAPKVRITLLGAALGRQAEVTTLWGSRAARARQAWRWLRTAGMSTVDALYVETSTTPVGPADLALLALARLRRRPVGIYFRDAYQRFRDLYPRRTTRQRISDLAWRVTTPLLVRLASVRFAPSEGLAQVLGLPTVCLLPPGTDPSLPDLGAGGQPLVAAVATLDANGGVDLLVAAMELVRGRVPGARLLVIGSGEPRAAWQRLTWLEVRSGNRPQLPELLRDPAVCVIPLPVNRYTDLAVPLRLMDLLALGKPIVATAMRETAAILGPSGAGLLVPPEPAPVAAAIVRVLEEPALAGRLAARARALALEPGRTWDARAATILAELSGSR